MRCLEVVFVKSLEVVLYKIEEFLKQITFLVVKQEIFTFTLYNVSDVFTGFVVIFMIVYDLEFGYYISF